MGLNNTRYIHFKHIMYQCEAVSCFIWNQRYLHGLESKQEVCIKLKKQNQWTVTNINIQSYLNVLILDSIFIVRVAVSRPYI